MDRICANALKVAQHLQNHPKVGWVNYAGLPDHKDHALVQKYMGGRASGIITFGVKLQLFTRRPRGRRALPGCAAAVHPAGQHRRRQVAGLPPGLHHAPPAVNPRKRLAKAGVIFEDWSEDMVRLSSASSTSTTCWPIWSRRWLPPTLLLQYHFDGLPVKPYVGAGINYTNFSGVSLPAGVTINNSSWGGALQAGVDIPLKDNMYLNLDLKKVWMGTDVYVGGVNSGSLNVNPLLMGVGLGWRF
jgi:hypothetical protein